MAKELISILEDSNKKYDNKESLTDFNFKVKKTSTKSFSEGQKCLQKLKDIKKNYKKPESTVWSRYKKRDKKIVLILS